MLTINDFQAAANRLKSVIHRVPLATSKTFSDMTGAEVYLKYENQQKTGSFKVRGAYNCGCHNTFCFATSHLCINYIVVHAIKTK